MGKEEWPLKFFICEGSHMVRGGPKQSMFSTIKEDDVPKKASMRLDSIMCGVEVKRGNENEKKPVKCFSCYG